MGTTTPPPGRPNGALPASSARPSPTGSIARVGQTERRTAPTAGRDTDHPADASASTGGGTGAPRPLVFTLGHRELVIRRRYQVLSIVNDILIAVWFTIGSIMFFSDAWTYTGTWLFVVGSIELLIRPAIRLTRQIHLQRLPGHQGVRSHESEHDF